MSDVAMSVPASRSSSAVIEEEESLARTTSSISSARGGAPPRSLPRRNSLILAAKKNEEGVPMALPPRTRPSEALLRLRKGGNAVLAGIRFKGGLSQQPRNADTEGAPAVVAPAALSSGTVVDASPADEVVSGETDSKPTSVGVASREETTNTSSAPQHDVPTMESNAVIAEAAQEEQREEEASEERRAESSTPPQEASSAADPTGHANVDSHEEAQDALPSLAASPIEKRQGDESLGASAVDVSLAKRSHHVSYQRSRPPRAATVPQHGAYSAHSGSGSFSQPPMLITSSVSVCDGEPAAAPLLCSVSSTPDWQVPQYQR